MGFEHTFRSDEYRSYPMHLKICAHKSHRRAARILSVSDGSGVRHQR